MTTVSDTVRTQKTIFGHPAGLFLLFFTEMWERFSYYGMRTLLVLYMVDYLIKRAQDGTTHVVGFAGLQHVIEGVYGPLGVQPLASEIYGLYTGFVYLTPLFGGMLADRILGQRKTVVIGGVLMAIGHFLMAIESMFLVALLFLIVGNGCFKPNISTQVGGLYPEGDPRLDRAYTIFYAGVNLGAFFSPLVCGTLGQVYGWHYGFAAAGVGMTFGLLLYLWGQRFLATDSLTRAKAAHTEKAAVTSKQRLAIFGFIAICIPNIVFWMVYEQGGNTLQLFADRNADWHIFGWEMPSTWYQAINSMFIFLLTPVLNMLWAWQALRKKEPSSVTKMAMGCTLLGLSFLPLIFITRGLADAGRISFLWLVGSTFIYTLGEMYLSPIGLSLVVKIAPPRMVSMMMGVWYLAISFGNYMAGHIGTYYEKMSHPSFFLMLLGFGVAAGLAIFALQKPLKNAVGHNT
ncbi:MAG TPA: peptide MFS transporter [Bryobacteraceae bacterium]|jgi:POT family proton-dependent oligopeptide transporter